MSYCAAVLDSAAHPHPHPRPSQTSRALRPATSASARRCRCRATWRSCWRAKHCWRTMRRWRGSWRTTRRWVGAQEGERLGRAALAAVWNAVSCFLKPSIPAHLPTCGRHPEPEARMLPFSLSPNCVPALSPCAAGLAAGAAANRNPLPQPGGGAQHGFPARGGGGSGQAHPQLPHGEWVGPVGCERSFTYEWWEGEGDRGGSGRQPHLNLPHCEGGWL